MKKNIVVTLLSASVLAACGHMALINDTTVADIQNMNCEQLDKENNYITLKINQLRVGHIPFRSSTEIADALSRAQERERAINETSVHKMCTFG